MQDSLQYQSGSARGHTAIGHRASLWDRLQLARQQQEQPAQVGNRLRECAQADLANAGDDAVMPALLPQHSAEVAEVRCRCRLCNCIATMARQQRQ